MPVRFVRQDGHASRVGVAEDPFWIGSAPDAHLVIKDPRVAGRHARVRYKKGEHVLSAADGATIWVNGEALPLMPLRHGDRVSFTPPDEPDPVQLVFENRLDDSFVPPGMTFAEAWIVHPRSADDPGPDAYGDGDLIDDRPTDRIRRVTDGEDLVVKVLGPIRRRDDAPRYLSLLSALEGAPHASLAPVVDGGLHRKGDDVTRWMVTRYVEGRISRVLIRKEGLDSLATIDVIAPVAYGLKHLHARGLVHRDVAPSNVIVRPDGRGALIDFGHTVAFESGVEPSLGVIGTPGYLAPEEVIQGGGQVTPAVDVYGLCAVAYALLTGSAPVSGGDLLETLGNAMARPPSPTELGFDVPEALETIIMGGLDPDPASRPTARDVALACEEARAVLEPDVWVEDQELA
jgi:serine/threonine protein kinase